jgi:Fibronectin type III domain
LLFSLFTVPAQAVSAITIGTTTFGAGVATNVGVSLSGFNEAQNYQVTVKFVNTVTNVDVTNGTLAATQSGTTLVDTYTSYSSSKLGFKGNYSQISNALSTLTWNPDRADGDISIRIGIATQPGTGEFYDANSGHYYRYVSDAATWTNARSAAEASTLFGLKGYLAIINTSAENNFVANETVAPDIWIGATEDATTTSSYTLSYPYSGNAGQRWIWDGATGADAPTEDGSYLGANPTITEFFQRWAVNEPNNDSKPGPDCAVTNWSGSRGYWNDLRCDRSQGYLIEYGGRTGETSTASTTTLTTTVVAREAVTLGTLRSNVSCTFGVDCSFPLSLTNPTAKNSSNVDVAGTFAYTSSNTASTTVSGVSGGASVALVNAGTSTITATFTPTNTDLYASNTKTFNITVTATAPAAPTGLSATTGNTQAALSWTAASNGGSNITDYLVQYSTDNSTWTTFADGTSTATSATVTGLTNGTLYYFRVSAINAVNTSSASSTASTTPVVPSSGGGGSTPTATPTPTPTPSATTTPRPRPTQSANPIIQNPLTIPVEPQPGRSNNPEPLVKKLIEDVANSLKPIIINIFTQQSPSPNPSFDSKRALEVATPTADKKVVELPSLVRIDNELQSSKLVVIDNTTVQVVTESGGLLSVEAKDGVTTIPVDNTGKVQMIRSNTVNTEGIGLQPNSEFAVYLFSEPTLLGVGKSDAAGKFFASFVVDKDFPLGNHTLQINGTLPDGKSSSISMPVTVIENADIARNQAMPKTILIDENPVTRATDALYLIIAIFAFLILFMLFGGSRLMLAAVRRRKDQ